MLQRFHLSLLLLKFSLLSNTNIMSATVAAAAISGGVSLANNAANIAGGLFGKKKSYYYNTKLQHQQNIYNQELAAQQNAYNRDLAQWAYDTEFENNVKMWNMENSYNTPAAQMERLRQAGLNPYMLNGNPPANTAGAVTPPDMKTPEAVGYPSAGHPGMSENMPEMQLDSVVNQFFNAQLKQKQIENIDAQNENIRQDTVNKAKQFDIMGLTEIYNQLRNRYADDMFSQDLAKRYNVNAKLNKELETLTYKLTNILPENFNQLVNKNSLLQQQFGFNASANPLKLKAMRFDNTYKWLRNQAQSIENKHLDDYWTLTNSNLTETNRQLFYANQLHQYGNDVLESIQEHGINMQNIGKLTRYYYLKQILNGVAPGVAKAEAYISPFETAMRPYNDMSDRFMNALGTIGGLIAPGRGFAPLPAPRWHEREKYDTRTGEQYYYERYR